MSPCTDTVPCTEPCTEPVLMLFRLSSRNLIPCNIIFRTPIFATPTADEEEVGAGKVRIGLSSITMSKDVIRQRRDSADRRDSAHKEKKVTKR